MARRRTPPEGRERLVVRRDVGPRPVAKYLAARLSLPVGWVRRLLAGGCVRIDGAVPAADGTHAFRRGTVVEVDYPADWPPHLAPRPMPLAILYEDEHLVALDKPPGVVVHPARGHMDGETLQNGLRYRYRAHLPEPDCTIGPAHRLDRDTSGVILFARRREAYRRLVDDFARGRVEKTYFAVVEGSPAFDRREVDLPLGVDPDVPSRGAVVSRADGGKPARTALRLLARRGACAWLEARPRTGRPHQVRLHCAACGHPVLGDADYASDAARHPIARQALHARRLRLLHPVTGAFLDLIAPVPADMRALGPDLFPPPAAP